MSIPDTAPQDQAGTAQDAAENRADRDQPSHYEAQKNDLRDNGAATAAPAAGAGAVQAQPPETFTGLQVGPPSGSAAGVKSVVTATRHVWGEMGVVRGTRALLQMSQKGGFDCMSCAWPDPDGDRSFAEFCENGAKALAWEGTTARVTPDFFRRFSVADLSQKSDYWLGQQGRLTHPMVLRAGATHYQPISWAGAFRLIAGELNALGSPDEAVFYTSGRTSNEAAFLYQLFVRQLGTNNLPDCSNMCHESSGAALAATIGIGKGTVKLEDFAQAQVILLIGQNPGTNHPRMLLTLQKAKRAGATILSVNPLPEAGLLRFNNPQEVGGLLGKGTPLTDLFLQVRVNGDVALLKGIMKSLLGREERSPGTVFARAFIEEKTAGFDEFLTALRAARWDDLVEQSGITRELMDEAAGHLARAERVIACWAMGLTQAPNAVATIQEIVNLLLLRGSIGKPGAGVCPVRGHSNVQGDRTVGIWERPRAEFLDALAREIHFDPPRHHGYDTVEAIKAMHAGKVGVFFALGGNFLSATPDTEYTAQALRNCKLTVQVSTKLNRAHLVTGKQALILPCLGRSERDTQASGPQLVSTENSMGVVQSSAGTLGPASEHLLSEPAIVAGLARATLGSRGTVDWEGLVANYDRIRDLIARVIPGFQDYNARVRRPGGFYLPNGPREGTFKTTTGKAHFTVHPLPEHKLGPGQLVMMTVRTHDQFNTTIYGLDDRYRGIRNERRVVLLNADEVREAGLKAGDVVDLTSHFRGQTRVARHFLVVPYNIPRRCAATYFPEANVLVPIDSVAEKSNTPTSKYVIITVAKSESAGKFDYDHVAGA
jgi:molybdopterin-dependent oxidoreductase alpha subunit